MAETQSEVELKKRIRKLEEQVEKLQARLKEKTAALIRVHRALREEPRRRKSAGTVPADSAAPLAGFAETTDCVLPCAEEGPEERQPWMEQIEGAFGVLFEKNRHYRQELEEKILENLNRLIMPYIDQLLERALDVRRGSLGNLPGARLDAPAPPYSNDRPAGCAPLTRAEFKVVDLLRRGHRTREIAEILKLSEKTIETHRKKIRKKFGLCHRKANLRTYLGSIPYPQSENAAGFQGAFPSADLGDPPGNLKDIDRHQEQPHRQPKRP